MRTWTCRVFIVFSTGCATNPQRIMAEGKPLERALSNKKEGAVSLKLVRFPIRPFPGAKRVKTTEKALVVRMCAERTELGRVGRSLAVDRRSAYSDCRFSVQHSSPLQDREDTALDSRRQQIIDQLIATYRELNMSVRPLDEATLSSGKGRESVRSIVERMRDDELRFAQALKERLSGVPMPDIAGDDAPIIGTETENDSTTIIISHFGTARATTLSMLREIGDSDWTAPVEGGKSIQERAQELAENDARQLERIRSLLGTARSTSMAQGQRLDAPAPQQR